jgi:hypothetical protein
MCDVRCFWEGDEAPWSRRILEERKWEFKRLGRRGVDPVSVSAESLRSRAVPVVDMRRFPAVNSRDERQTRHAGGWRVGGGSRDIRDAAPAGELPGRQGRPSPRWSRRRHPGGGRARGGGDRWSEPEHRGRWVWRQPRRRRSRGCGGNGARPGGHGRRGGRRIRPGRRWRCRRSGRWRRRRRRRHRPRHPRLAWLDRRRVDDPGGGGRLLDGLGQPGLEGLRHLRSCRRGVRRGRHLCLRLQRQRDVRRPDSMHRVGSLPRRLRGIGLRGRCGLRWGRSVSRDLRGGRFVRGRGALLGRELLGPVRR